MAESGGPLGESTNRTCWAALAEEFPESGPDTAGRLGIAKWIVMIFCQGVAKIGDQYQSERVIPFRRNPAAALVRDLSQGEACACVATLGTGID